MQFNYRVLCSVLGRRANPPIKITDPVTGEVRILSRDGQDFDGEAPMRQQVFFQIFNLAKAKNLNPPATPDSPFTFRNRGQNMAIDKLSLVTNGEVAYLTFEVHPPPGIFRKLLLVITCFSTHADSRRS